MVVKSTTLTGSPGKKDTVLVNVFLGIDRSTSRYRIKGKGERLYETSNIFPYIQGELNRRRDTIQTNSRASDAAFPTFPATSLTGDPVIKKVWEFNNTICIAYEDSGDTGKLLVDSFDTGANTLTARIHKTSKGGSPYTFTAGGDVDAVAYNSSTASPPDISIIDPQGSKIVYLRSNWTNALDAGGNVGDGVNEVFLQSFHHTNDPATTKFGQIGRTPVGNDSIDSGATYQLADFVGRILRMMSFGYQTSSAGATTVLLYFKPSSIWVQTGIGATESFEQVTGNIGLAGLSAATYSPFGVCFVGRDTDGLLNLYLLDRNSLVLHTIGHELYEELNDIPKGNYSDIVLSFHRNRMIRIALTKTGDAVENNKEYWLDFYNGIKKRTLWGPNHLPASNSLVRAIGFSGGADPTDSGFFMILKESGTHKIYEEINTDTYDSTDTEWDDMIARTKIYDFGRYYGIISKVIIVAKANGAKFNVYYEVPKAGGDDDDTTITQIGTTITMGTGGEWETKSIRIVPAILRKQIGFKVASAMTVGDPNPIELSQIGFEYTITQREIIE